MAWSMAGKISSPLRRMWALLPSTRLASVWPSSARWSSGLPTSSSGTARRVSSAQPPSSDPRTRARPTLLRARPFDLGWAIPEGAKDPVVQPRAALGGEEVGVDVFPDDPPIGGDLEQATVTALADQGVAVGQTLGAGDVRAEEVEEGLVAVLPDDLARAG